MKKYLAFIVYFTVLVSISFAEEPGTTKVERIPSVVFAPNFIGPLFGLYSGDVSFKAADKISLDSEIGYFNIKTIPIVGSALPEDSNFWFGNLKIGPTLYLDKAYHGVFLGAYVKGAYFVIGSNTDNLNATSLGVGAKLGWRWTWDWFSLALGGGYEFNKAFVEVKNSDPLIASQLNSIEGAFPYVLFKMEIAVY
ncbi:MAG: hypothetical protein A2Z96_06455 [Spirochaetes bacterium GWB1_48_6]|nr:MAG: hypothetical protein A2Z96_06455 [Spirochaetes bacterium GWB1_48_6]